MLNQGIRQRGWGTHAGGDPHVPEMRERRDGKLSGQETAGWRSRGTRGQLGPIWKGSDGALATDTGAGR